MAHGSRKIRHLDNVEAISQHLGVKLGAGRQVQPLNLVFSIFVLAVVRKILFKQVQFSNDGAASGAVDRGILGSDANPYFFTGLKLRCDDEHHANRGRQGIRFDGFHDVAVIERFNFWKRVVLVFQEPDGRLSERRYPGL